MNTTSTSRRSGNFKMEKIIILGWDGATWDLFRPLARSGFLPNLERLVEEGLTCRLHSVHPPATATAWVSFATGKNPGKHGVFDFLSPKGSLSRLRSVTSHDIRTETFYEVIARHGGKIVLVNLPVSFPPRLASDNHIVLTSIMTQGDEYVWPPELKARFPILRRYRVAPDPLMRTRGSLDAYITDIRNLEAIRFECARQLFEETSWDLFFYMISGTDWIQHRLYQKLVEGKVPESSPALKALRDFDSYLGWFLDNKPREAWLFLISDHGFSVRKGCVYVNTFLWQHDWLKATKGNHESHSLSRPVEQGSSQTRRSARIRLPNSLLSLLMRHQAASRIARFLWLLLKRHLPLRFSWQVASPSPGESEAFMPSDCSWGLYLNRKPRFDDGVLSEDEAQDLAQQITASMKELTTPFDGKPVFDWVRLANEIYSGPYTDEAPDIVFYSKDFQPHADLAPRSSLFRLFSENSHSLEGLLGATGPYINRNSSPESASLIDIAPTVLHLMGLPVIDDMDGRILVDLFESDSPPARRPVARTSPVWTESRCDNLPSQGEEVVRERLKGLGYLS